MSGFRGPITPRVVLPWRGTCSCPVVGGHMGCCVMAAAEGRGIAPQFSSQLMGRGMQHRSVGHGATILSTFPPQHRHTHTHTHTQTGLGFRSSDLSLAVCFWVTVLLSGWGRLDSPFVKVFRSRSLALNSQPVDIPTRGETHTETCMLSFSSLQTVL